MSDKLAWIQKQPRLDDRDVFALFHCFWGSFGLRAEESKLGGRVSATPLRRIRSRFALELKLQLRMKTSLVE